MNDSPRLQSLRPDSRRGFTLIELMLVVVVLGILAAVALPSYQQQVMKSRRSDAFTALAQVVQAQERWRSNNSTYAGNVATLFPNGGLTTKHYLVEVSQFGPNFTAGYEVHATPLSGSSQAADSTCPDIFIRVSGGQMNYLDTNSATTLASSVCWPQ